MKNNQDNYFEEYIKNQSDEKVEILKDFFQEFHTAMFEEGKIMAEKYGKENIA